MKKVIVFFGVILLCLPIIKAQKAIPLSLNAGFSLPEGLHLGLKSGMPNYRLGVLYGQAPPLDEGFRYVTYSVDQQIHFGRVSEVDSSKIFYARQGFTYGKDKYPNGFTEYYMLNVAFGRHIPYTRKAGMFVDFGVFTILHSEDFQSDEGGTNLFDIRFEPWMVFPVIRVQFYMNMM